MTKPLFIYVASPYSHPKFEVREKRYRAVFNYVLDNHMDQGRFLYSPIMYHHPIVTARDLPHTAADWWEANKLLLRKSDGVLVLTLPNWEASVGIDQEVKEAHRLGLDVEYVSRDLAATIYDAA